MKEKTKLDSVKLVYNEKSKRIVAHLITDVNGVKVNSKTIDNVEVIKILIDALVKQSKHSVTELVDSGIINVDDKLLDQGAIILDGNKKYHKYVFDKSSGTFVETRLSRKERIDLGIFGTDELVDDVKTTEKEEKADTVEKTELKEEIKEEVKKEVEEVKEDKETIKEEAKEEKETEEVKKEDTTEVKSEDGAISLPEENIKETKKKEEVKSVKNLKVRRRAFALLGGAAILVVGMHIADLIHKYSGEGSKTSTTTKTRVEEQTTVDNSYTSSDVIEVQDESGVIETFDDYSMSSEDIVQCINDLCASYYVCNFTEFVDPSDQMSVEAINNERNAALTDKSKLSPLMDDYSKYIFDGSIWFGNNVIKGYDYLAPISKYAVLVSGQTGLQLHHDNNPGYNYVIGGRSYTFEQLIDMYDERVNMVYSELISKGKTY